MLHGLVALYAVGVVTLVEAALQSIHIKEDLPTATSTPPPTAPPSGGDPACVDGSLLEVTFSLDASTDKIYGTVDGFSSFFVTEGDRFEYEMMWMDAGTRANVDLESVGVGWRLRDDEALKDAKGYTNHCEKEGTLGESAVGHFYHRSFDLTDRKNMVDLLVLAANPGNGKTVKMLVKYIRVTRKGKVVHDIWSGAKGPLTVRPYFPGTITTSCRTPFILESRTQCKAESDDIPWSRSGSRPFPAALHENVTCTVNVTAKMDQVEKGKDIAVELLTASVVVRRDEEDIPFLHNGSYPIRVENQPAVLTKTTPSATFEVSFQLGGPPPCDCCSKLLADVFALPTLTIDIHARSTSFKSAITHQVHRSAVRVTCSKEDFEYEDGEVHEGLGSMVGFYGLAQTDIALMSFLEGRAEKTRSKVQTIWQAFLMSSWNGDSDSKESDTAAGSDTPEGSGSTASSDPQPTESSAEDSANPAPPSPSTPDPSDSPEARDEL